MANETQIYVGKLGVQTLYKRLKQLIGRITTYKKVPADEHGHPVESNPDSRTIYLVKDESVVGEDKFFEWIWTAPNIWECIGTTSEPCNSWKQWSEENGSSGEGDSVYIGKNNELDRDESYSLGKDNTVEVTDDTDYTNTDIVEIGTSNTATNAANAYQLGRENTVTGNNLAKKQTYPHSMALNLGRNNAITGEGVNIGKDNDSTTFGINIGQNNFSSNASCSVGQHVMSDDASLAMGNAEQTLANVTVGNVPTLLVNGSYEHVQRFRFKEQYHYCELATIYQDPADNKYKWAAVQSTRLRIYPNYELDQYLVSWGSGAQGGTITGYYDEEGVFHESSDTSHNIHTYGRITNVGNPSGSERVDLNPPFYASFLNQEQTQNYITYVMRAEITLPAYGTILTRSEYETLIAGSVTPVMMGSISGLFINLDDLTADGYKVPGLTGTNALPFPLSYEVYGYKDNDVLIPYNELNKNEAHDFDWYEVDWSDIKGNTLPVKQVNPRSERIVAVNRSATLGMGSLYASGRSITISTNSVNAYQMRYDGTYETNMYRTYSGTCYTINQNTGNYTTKSTTISCFTKQYGGSFTSKVAPYCASADGASIVISNEYGTAYGSSVAIGNYANADGFSYVVGRSSTANSDAFAFGNAAFGYNHSMALGFDNSYATRASLSFGMSGVSAYDRSVAIGFDGITSQNYSLAIACGGYANGKSMIFGFNNNASNDAIAIGRSNSIYQEATGLGANNVMYYQNIAIGYSNNMQNTSDTSVHATLIGTSNTTGPGGYNIGIGENNVPSDEAIAIGRNNRAYGWSIALGANNRSAYVRGGHATIIGYNNKTEYNQEAITFYDKNSTISTSYTIPFYSYYYYSITEQLYLADELGASGTISGMQLECSYYPCTRKLRIYLVTSTKTQFNSASDWVPMSSSNEVFAGNFTFNTGWNYIEFSRSVSYTAGYQLLLVIVDETGSYVSSMSSTVYKKSSNDRLTLGLYRDSTPYNATTSITSDSIVDGSYRNTVRFLFNDRTVEIPATRPLTGNIETNSMIMGVRNTAKHYNSILLGAGNFSKPEKLEGNSNPSDDGFVLAIGRENIVGRNYDMAIGYKSVANGGENIAIQHSTATGYRNIAMIDSTLTDCTANIAVCESSLTLDNVYSPKTNVIHNTLLHSNITATLGLTSNNVFMHTNGIIATRSANGIHRNFIMVGTEYHQLSITSDELSNNIIYGFRRGYFLAKSFSDNSGPVAISTGGSFDRNIMLNNAYGAFTASVAMNDNIIHSTELNVSGVSYFSDNIIASSLVNITRAANVVNNVMLGRSKIDIQAAATEANNNFLMYSYLGDNDHGSAISTGEYSSQANTGYMTQNFLYGSNAYNVQATVSFASPDYNQAPERASYEGYYKGEYPYSTQLIDCANVFNFGDNLIKGVNRATVFGIAHNIHSSMNAFVFGTHNELSYTDGSIVMGERNFVLGMNQAYHDNVTHTIILGSNNNVKATNKADYNMIFGANNNIKGDFTVVTKTSAQIASLPSNVKEYIKASADCIRPTSSTVIYIYKNYYYFYSNGCLITTYSTKPTGVSTIVDVSDVSTFVSMYSRRSLTEGTWYHVLNTGSSYRIDAPSGILVKSTKVYYHYNDTLVELGNYSGSTGDIAIYNSFNRIFGNANNLYDHVMNYTVVGEGNIVKCTNYSTPYDYAISNGFVQGNNNFALNGSNIICMGNGNQSTGHNSVAIGSQLISNQWQTVLGKYNAAIAGPNRLASETPQDPTKALLIVGNGYSTKDDSEWQDETYITRSNALELYADGRLKVTGAIEAANIPAAPVGNGSYALTCEVTNGVATYRWVPVGLV